MFYICRITCNVPVLGTVRLYDVLHPNAAVPRPSLDPDVAALPEARPPGVLDQPVVHSVFVGAVTNHSYGVVGIGYGGVTSGKYSGAVRAEGRGRLSNSNLPCLEKIYYDYM